MNTYIYGDLPALIDTFTMVYYVFCAATECTYSWHRELRPRLASAIQRFSSLVSIIAHTASAPPSNPTSNRAFDPKTSRNEFVNGSRKYDRLLGFLCIKDGVLGHEAVKGTVYPGNHLPLLRAEQNVPKNVVFGDNA